MQSNYKKFFLTLIKYISIFLLFFILSKASIYNLIFPFAYGLFFALIFCNVNMFIISPLFILATLINNFSLVSVLGVVFAVIFSLFVFSLHIKLKKPIKLWLFIVYTIFAQGGYVFAEIYFNNTIIVPLITVACATLFMLATREILSALIIRASAYKLNLVEIVSGLIFLCALSCGLYELTIFGFEVLKFVAFLVILISASLSPIGNTILVASILGMGALITAGSIEFIAPFIILGFVVSIFKTKNRFLPVIAIILSEFLLGFYLNIYFTYSIIAFLPVVLASLVFLCLPQKLLNNLLEILSTSEDSFAMRNVVNRSRENLCKRLFDLSDVFAEMDYVFRSMIKGGMTKEQVKTFLVGEVKEKVCADCAEKNSCHRMCAEETSRVLEVLIGSALERGKTTLLDVPPFLTSKCGRVSNLVGAINQLCSQYKQYAGVMNNLDASRVLIAEQLCGVSKIMKNLAGEVNKNISFDNVREEVIISELSYNNILCCDAVIYEQNTDVVSATVVVRKIDTNKPKIPEVVSKICKNKMIVSEINSSNRAGWDVLTLKTAPKYNIVFGTASCTKDGSKISGDCYSVIKIANDKFLLALCDGMGSGEKAEKTSSLAIGLVENFYKAGFDNDIILSSINKLLSLNKEEIFSALDICVLDTRQGVADFIKMGAPNTFIKHNSTTDKIVGGTLPLGIIQDIEPMINKKVLSTNDFIFMFTDGISDSFESEEILQDYINNLTGTNPQILAENIINKSIKNNNGIRDDMTIIVAKIFKI